MHGWWRSASGLGTDQEQGKCFQTKTPLYPGRYFSLLPELCLCCNPLCSVGQDLFPEKCLNNLKPQLIKDRCSLLANRKRGRENGIISRKLMCCELALIRLTMMDALPQWLSSESLLRWSLWGPCAGLGWDGPGFSCISRMLDLITEMLSNLALVTLVNQWPGYNRQCGSLALMKRGRQVFLNRAGCL